MDFKVTMFAHGQSDETPDGTSDQLPSREDRPVFGCDIAFQEPISTNLFLLLLNCRPFKKHVEIGRRTRAFGRRAKNEIILPVGILVRLSPTEQRANFSSESDRDSFIAKVSPVLTRL